jgi:hypothetical protein
MSQNFFERALAPISTYNLAEAVKALPQFQREFRRLLGHVVVDTELTQVERQERQSFTEAWYLWYFFGAHPRRVVSNAQSLIGQATEIVKRIRTSLRRQLRALSAGEVEVSIASEKALWDFEPALWLTINGVMVKTPLPCTKFLSLSFKPFDRQSAQCRKRNCDGTCWTFIGHMSW